MAYGTGSCAGRRTVVPYGVEITVQTTNPGLQPSATVLALRMTPHAGPLVLWHSLYCTIQQGGYGADMDFAPQLFNFARG